MDKDIKTNCLMGSIFHKQKRQQFASQMAPNSIAFFSSAELTPPNFNRKYGWRQNAEFYYLTGIAEPDCHLIMIKTPFFNEEEVLFIPRINPHYEIWEGKMISENEAKHISGNEQLKFTDGLDAFLNSLISKVDNLYIQNTLSPLGYSKTRYGLKIAEIKDKFPYLNFKATSQITDRMRWQKSEIEISKIKTAIDITHQAIKAASSMIKVGNFENQVEASLNHAYLNSGCIMQAFTPIVAAGINSTVLHYGQGLEMLNKDDVLLLDTGAQYGYYCADVTRVFPAGEKFSPQALDIYNMNLEIQQDILKQLKVGQTFRQIAEISEQVQIKTLKKNKIIQHDADAKKYTIHNIGHPMGIEVHDPPNLDWPLLEGSVITIEPGLYFRDKKIGVRIEDDILFTATGTENLTAKIQK